MALGFTGPVESKVKVAAVASAVASVAVWALQRYVFKGDVPVEVSTAVQLVVPALFAFIGGLLARHTPRPDLRPAEPSDEEWQAAADALADDEPGAHALDGRGRDGNPEQPVDLFDPHRP
jgi:hypothetical protein